MDILTKALPCVPIPAAFLVEHCSQHDDFMGGCLDCLAYSFIACLADNLEDFQDAR